MSIDSAITRLQSLALQTSITVRSAPAKPVSDASVLPMSIAHLRSGEMRGGDTTMNVQMHTVGVDFHVSRISLRQAYTELDAIVPEYMNLLAGDPTLQGAVDTIDLANVTYSIQPAQWDTITTLAAFFSVPIKIMGTPSTSST
jgi:hypothetical protein